MDDAATAVAFESPLLDVRESARYLRCKPCTIRSMIQQGVLAYVRVGNRFCVRKAELDRWIKANEFRLVCRSKLSPIAS